MMASYTEEDKNEIVNRICKHIETNNASLRDALMLHDTPTAETFYRWIDNDTEKAKQYARACELRAEHIFEEILEIADDSTRDTIITPEGKEIVNSEFVARSRVRIDARKWMLGKMQPKKYGDKLDLTSGGERIQQAVISIDPLNDKPDNSATEDMQS